MTATSVAPRTATTHRLHRGAGAAFLVTAGLLHLFITPEYIKEQLYIGLLFALSVPLTLVGAAWLWRRDERLAWLYGAALCVGMIVGFLLSRTVGLPGFDESGSYARWAEGFPALAVELGFLIVAVGALRAPGLSSSRTE